MAVSNLMKLGWAFVVLVLVSCSDPERAISPMKGWQCAAPNVKSDSFGWTKQTQGKKLIVTTSDYTAGAVQLLDLATGKFEKVEGPASPDARARTFFGDNRIFQLNRFRFDNLRILDSLDLGKTTPEEIKDKDESNPADLIVVGDTVYMSRTNENSIQKFGLNPLRKLEEIPFPEEFIDEDGYAEPTAMMLRGKYILIILQRLERRENGQMIGVRPGWVVSFDTKTEKFDKVAELNGANPTSGFKFDPGSQPYTSSLGRYYRYDGGIDAWWKEGFVVSERQLNGDIVSFDWVSEDSLLVISESSQEHPETFKRVNYTTKLSHVDLSGVEPHITTLKESSAPSWQSFSGIKYVGNCGAAFVMNRDAKRPGLNIIDTKEMKFREDVFIDVRLPPYHLELMN